jgi:hypothetical protein
VSSWYVIEVLSREVVGIGRLDEPGVLFAGFFEGAA